MENILKSVMLGIIQSVTEFLPVSSSGHLIILKKLIDVNLPIIFDIYLHFATVLVVFIYYRKKIAEFFLTLVNFFSNRYSKLDFENLNSILMLLVIVFVTGIVGVFFDRYKELFSLNLILVNFVITGILLFVLKIIPFKLDLRKNVFISGVFIGIMQGIGIMPGISRSGITIFAAVVLGFSIQKALEISFLSLILIVFGGILIKSKDFFLIENIAFSFFEINVGAITAFVVGLISINFLMKVFESQKFYYFSIYLFLLSGVLYFFF